MNEKPESVPPTDVGPPKLALQFYIPATSSLAERRPRILKHGDTFGVFDHYGDIVVGEGGPEGLFHQDTRYLSGFQFLVNELRPLLLSSTVQDNNAMLTVDLTNPDFFADGELSLAKDTIHIVRSKFIWQGACHERFLLHNYDSKAHAIGLRFLFQSDFADIFEVRGHRRRARGRQAAAVTAGNRVTITYTGLDSAVRRTTVQFDPDPVELDEGSAAYRVELAPGRRTSLFVTVTCDRRPPRHQRPKRFFACLHDARRALRATTCRGASVETSNAIFNELLCRSMADLYMLTTETGDGPYPYAGIPWFSTAFGRDGILTAIQMLWIDPELARGVLRYLAARQANERLAEADAEPGKILHETRSGEMARLGEVPFARYYGSVDSTPLFVMLAGMYMERTGDLQTISRIWASIEAALDWIDAYGDRDGDGFVEYRSASRSGLANQGWKDSHDSIFHADGRLAEGPIALSEVQGYAYAAKQLAARMARRLGHEARSQRLREEAADLRKRFEDAFWCDDMSLYALALDGDKRPCRVRASNAGQVLLSGIAAPDRAARVADALLGQSLFSGWGVRTVAEQEARYNPMSYHNGSIWPHDNALFALGLSRYGLKDHVGRLFAAMFDAATYMELRRLPELFCGFRRRPGKGPTFYPVACSPQAWASAVPFAFLQATLGLRFDSAAEEIHFDHPHLPEFLDEVVIRSLRVGGSRMDVGLHRYGSEVTVNVLRKTGGGRVVVKL